MTTASSSLPRLPQGYLSLFRSSQCTKPQFPPKDTDLSGQTAIISGANAGLGLQCARLLLDLKLSHLILASRSLERGNAAAKSLRENHPQATVEVEVWALDMASYPSIQDFARRCGTLPRLDLVILNAGLVNPTFELAPTGHEEMFQVNYLSTVFLSMLLLPVLAEKAPQGAPGRLTVVSSGLSMHAKFAEHAADPLFPAFGKQAGFDPMERYATTKLLQHLWAYRLADFVSADDVVVNLVDPGFCKGTDLHRNASGVVKIIIASVKSLTGRSLEAGAATYIDAAVIKGKESHGSYVMDWRIFPYGEFFYTPHCKEATRKLWDETLEALSFADVKNILAEMKARKRD
ncbi:NAD(P)-binding protein [Sodiomyces alkalinus F11]|uniref:NAD(P)-binding protein n=1 Tax=Sodiomyces alkalinus (strain CBS 110278 / VKM F-3762 / F11) TaxID=1314773 RepID=A0A3N2PUX0_SODAK|nr:NAD(P)-binding protein [Sodiomyces alkalinus F11]ROT38307.1 NAD(P)-binding protein [Sodiomyces alkalinus F11]